jgi:DNA polymerase-3 subunit chi
VRADFYLVVSPRFAAEPLLLVCELAKKAFASGQPCVILCASEAQAETLDDLLWSFDEDAFIPHQIAGQDDDGSDAEVDVLLAPPGTDVPLRPLLINLRDGAFEGDFQRVLEVVPPDPAAREPLRQRWRAYQARGFTLNKYEL